jgi:UDPglucose--hexose-1-phosphate uridylyltransferase
MQSRPAPLVTLRAVNEPPVGPAPVWEQRWHPLRREWVILASHRDARPWSGLRGERARADAPRLDPTCYLCPGNERVGGVRNPAYEGVFTFTNDHPPVGPGARDVRWDDGLYRVEPATGLSRVMCYSPRHDLALCRLPVPEIVALIEAWRAEYAALAARREVAHVLIFENKGNETGVSNPHPHCQIYATNFVFSLVEREEAAARAHRDARGTCLFCDVVAAERRDGRRILDERERAIAFVPFFARYAYEVYVMPRPHRRSLLDLEPEDVRDLAAVLKDVLTRYDNRFEMPFPYLLAIHQAPTAGGDHDGFHLHIELQPPLRQPGLLKFLAGPELGGGNFLGDTSPEAKAAELRAAGTAHYLERRGS